MTNDRIVYGAVAGSVAASAVFIVLTGLFGGSESSAYWYFSRSAGLVAYGLLWLNMVTGLSLTGRFRAWVAPATTMELHRGLSGTALAFGLFHGLVLVGDRYIGFSLADVLLPLSGSFEPVWVAGGQLALCVLAALMVTSSMRRQLGNRTWRLLHYTSFLAYWMALVHALVLGSDSGQTLVLTYYAVTAMVVVWLTAARILVREASCGR